MATYQIVNYTPHPVTLIGHDGAVRAKFPVDGTARVSEIITPGVLAWDPHGDCGITDEVPLATRSLGEVVGLPEPREYVRYIVSIMVQQALPQRRDLIVPHDVVRDAQGQIIGCRGFAVAGGAS